MGSGKGGGSSAGPMLEYGDKALALQKQQYQDAKTMSQPWVNAGTSAIGELANLMGLSGGTGTQTRDQIYNQLLPQYTKNTAASPQGSLYYTRDGRVVNTANIKNMNDYYSATGVRPVSGSAGRLNNIRIPAAIKTGDWSKLGFSPISAGGGQSIDYAGLNSAVDAALANQKTPDNFGSLLKTFSGEDLTDDPSYQWRFDQGQKAAERQLAASGKYLTPAASQALAETGQNMASQEYQNAYNRFNNNQDTLFNRLAAISGVGQAQSGQVMNAGANYANSASDIYTGMGNAVVAAKQANAANKGSMFNTLLSAGANLGSSYLMSQAAPAAMFALSDANSKQDITYIGVENGFNIYSFRYKHDPRKVYTGVLAQEIIKTRPDAVRRIGKYLAVNYDAIGVKMRQVSWQ